MSKQIVGFNYDSIEVKDRESVAEHARSINSLLEKTAANIIEIGERLMGVKERLPVGMFTGWLFA